MCFASIYLESFGLPVYSVFSSSDALHLCSLYLFVSLSSHVDLNLAALSHIHLIHLTLGMKFGTWEKKIKKSSCQKPDHHL